tara:strand:- start:994 stop:1650 length:657 start_codon:yes stop_codon:yes gene_type:complete
MTLKLNGSSSGSVSIDAPASTTSGADITFNLPVADGSANQVLKTDASGNLGWSNGSVLTASAETSWTSVGTGTSFTLTGISASAKRLTLLADKISPDGGVSTELRIGDSGGVETTGYITESYYAGGSAAGASVTTSFKINGTGAASYRQSGAWEFWNLNGNLWYCQAFAHSADGTSPAGGHLRAAQGVKELSGTLDRIQVYIASGNLDMGNVKLITWT